MRDLERVGSKLTGVVRNADAEQMSKLDVRSFMLRGRNVLVGFRFQFVAKSGVKKWNDPFNPSVKFFFVSICHHPAATVIYKARSWYLTPKNNKIHQNNLQILSASSSHYTRFFQAFRGFYFLESFGKRSMHPIRFLLLVSFAPLTSSFVIVTPAHRNSRSVYKRRGCHVRERSWGTQPPLEARVVRRNLKKKKKQKGAPEGLVDEEPTSEEGVVEVKPLVRAVGIQRGEDYWIDEEAARREELKATRRKERLERETESVPIEKLKDEITAPYRENWIGFFTVGVIVLTVIVTQFPALLEAPQIGIPDL